jgi:mono/diheme cytochrome c family protein
MKRLTASILMGAAAALSMNGVLAQPAKVDLGKSEYMANCASCHGVNGKGNGPNAPFLNRTATDLTTLAKNNGGVLPISRLYDSIDGEKMAAGHGTRDMPTWGFDYRVRAAEYYGEYPYDSAQHVRSRILALIEYISRLQAK